MRAFFLLLFYCLGSIEANCQSFYNYVETERQHLTRQGADRIVISAYHTIHAVGFHSIYFFYKVDSMNYAKRVVYIDDGEKMRFLRKPETVKIRDSEVFPLLLTIEDSLTVQMKRMETILSDSWVENGIRYERPMPVHGNYHFLRYWTKGKDVVCDISNVNANDVYARAKWYWLARSILNNCIVDKFE